MERLSYDHDRDLLRVARPLRKRSHPLVVLRHADARSRKAWRQDDRLRPLVQAGRHQAQRLVPVLAAYGVARVVSSSSTRCVETVGPFADTTGWKLELEDGLSEEDASTGSVRAVVQQLVAGDEPAVLCTHRPVLPEVFHALGLPDPKLDKGAMLVVHLREGMVTATERHVVG
jgi:8-oxo-dGTP diphosphatase